MNWKDVAKEDLMQYSLLKAGYAHNNERIKTYEERLDRLIQNGKGNDNKTLDCIAKIEKLKLNNAAVEPLIKMIEESLAMLTQTERKVLTKMIINSERGALIKLCEELNYEKSRIYQIKDAALRKFTVAMYAVESL